MSYKITHYNQKPIVVREHIRDKRVVRPYTKGNSWSKRLKVWIWNLIRKPIIYSLSAMIFVSFMVTSFYAGALWRVYNPMPVAEAQTLSFIGTTTPTVDPVTDQLHRIEFAESHDNQFCTTDAITHGLCTKSEEGMVLMRANSNNSVDIGIAQINNKAWGAESVKLGYNLYTQDGNEKMARYILSTTGLKAWSSSKQVWK